MTPHTQQNLSKAPPIARSPAPNCCALVRELRQLLNLTQEQFAAKIGVTLVTVNRWENNRAKPIPLALDRLKALLVELSESQLESHRLGAQTLLNQYFANKEP